MPFWIGCTSISIKWNHFIVLTFSQVFLYIFLVSVKILCDKVRLKAIFGCILLGRYISSCIDITATESTNITTIRKWTVVYDLSLTLVNISYYISYYWSHVPSNACIQTKTLVDTYEWIQSTNIVSLICITEENKWKIYVNLNWKLLS